MSANRSEAVAIARAAVGIEGNRSVLDPLAGIPNHPFFDRKLRFFSGCDSKGRIRLYAMTIQD
ncbi:hypothetical protein HWC80_gp062 [Mycobacterium phage Indlulamithi]|uniref:Uncharacterized protein n=1 Tax=Mycobacterium phage Indlulamithi TaxID=2656582 RepID=A0A649VDF2_9CAUD|nr:hypothetical protein HWC80_gp062 [Mycobacterium phage Indlulamithi]QGJ90149.1 hypothetical protein PBI_INDLULAMITHI_112 [Mycobacterium phage Indlulamithi]